MKIATIDYEKLTKLITFIRNQKRLPMQLRRELATEILKQADVISRTDIENLMCIPCAAKLANFTYAGFRRKAERELHIYRLCHRERLNRFVDSKGAMIEYVDRREVLEVKKDTPPKRFK